MPAGGLYTGAWAQAAVRRYLRLWLPLLTHHPDPAERESLIPPVDVALVWMLHRALDIHAYVDDCNMVALSSAAALGLPTDREPELLGAGPEQALGFGDGEGAVGAFSAEVRGRDRVWQEWSQIIEEGRASPPALSFLPGGPPGQPYWPPQLPAAGTGGGGAGSSRRPGEAWEEELQGRLVSALPHASWLLRRLLACGFDGSPQHLEIALDRYCRFLLLAQRHAHEALLPPADVLAVWWAHKAHLGCYLADMDVVMGGPFDMPLTALDLEDPELAAYTAQMYEQEYGLPYDPPYSPTGCPPLPPHPFARQPKPQPRPPQPQPEQPPQHPQPQQLLRLQLQDALGRRLEWEAAAAQLSPLRTFFDSGALLMARLTTANSMSTSRNRVAAAAGVACSGAPTSPACAPLTPSLRASSSVGVGGGPAAQWSANSYRCSSASQQQRQALALAQGQGQQRQGRGSAGGSQPLAAAAEAALTAAAAGGGGWECPSPGGSGSSGSSTSGSSGSVAGAPRHSRAQHQSQQQQQQQQDQALQEAPLAPPSPPQQALPLQPQQLSPPPGSRPQSRTTPLAKLGSALRDLLHRSRNRSRRRRSVSANGFPGVTAAAAAGSGGSHPAMRGAFSWRQDSAAAAGAAAAGGAGAGGAAAATAAAAPVGRPGGPYPTHSGEMAAGGGGERGSAAAAGPNARASQEVLARALTVDVCPGGGFVPASGGRRDEPDWSRPSAGLPLAAHTRCSPGQLVTTGPLVTATAATRAAGSPMPSSGGFTVAAALAAAAAADASAGMISTATETAAPTSSPFPTRGSAAAAASATAPGAIAAPSSAPFASSAGAAAAAAARAAAGSPTAAAASREAAARQQRASYSGTMGSTLVPSSPPAPASTPLAVGAPGSHSQGQGHSYSQTQSHCYSHSYSAYGGMPATRTVSAGWSGPFGPGGAAGLPMTPSPTVGGGGPSAPPASAPLVLPLCSEVLAMFQETAVAHGPPTGAPPGSRPRSSLGLRGSFCGGAGGSSALPSAIMAVHVPRAGTELRYLLWLAEKALPAAEAEAAAALERRHSASASGNTWRAAAAAALAAAAVSAAAPASTAAAAAAAATGGGPTPTGAAALAGAATGAAPAAAAAAGNISANSSLRRRNAKSRAGFVRRFLAGMGCGLAGGRRRGAYLRGGGGNAEGSDSQEDEEGEEPGALMQGGPSAIAARWSAVASLSSSTVPPAAASAPPSGLAAAAGGGGAGAASSRRAARRYRKAVACALARAVVRQAAGFGTFAHLPMRSDHPFWEETLMGGFHFVSGSVAAAGSAGSSAYPAAAAMAGGAAATGAAAAGGSAGGGAAAAAAAAVAVAASGAVSGRPWLLAPWASPRLRGVVLRGRAWRVSLDRAIAASPRP
ncbi:hypothetical protein HXX76_001375 [Chlamydomonas incerta]|uniref:Uncharacterized protein n=1 Tax=Chlamydomonas incerta TaxID=51695 RepID=A0A835WC48_CHLIN|nr:hypothetical protein HXX76_001375 [Chlamydomonas incerta]|eukprot:KAG2444631.1 hypothetical protein HXX76_001375 [Chlamydomonas incerta]